MNKYIKINQGNIRDRWQYATFTPAIKVGGGTDAANQVYSFPTLDDRRGMYWIVGRAITDKVKCNAPEIETLMEFYRTHGWEYYLKY